MNLSAARSIIKSKMGEPNHFIYTGSRNQVEEFDGMIVNCYPSVFVIRTIDNQTKSFSYNDFIIKNLKIISCNKTVDFSNFLL